MKRAAMVGIKVERGSPRPVPVQETIDWGMLPGKCDMNTEWVKNSPILNGLSLIWSIVV